MKKNNRLTDTKMKYFDILAEYGKELEVIGNVHDN